MLHVPELRKPDVTITITNNRILLASKRGDLTEGDLAAFLKNPSNLLKSFSIASDRYRPLRRMTLYGLLLGFPILLFIMVYSVLRIGMDMMLYRRFGMTQRSATIATAMLCLVIGIGLYWPMRAGTPGPIPHDRLPDVLTANTWPERVAALRHVEAQHIELANYPQYRNLLRSVLPVERYWLARALAASRSPSTYPDLLSLVDDVHMAEDVVGEVLLALLKNIRQIDPDTQCIAGWLRSVVRHKVADHHRRKYRRKNHLMKFGQSALQSDLQNDPAERLSHATRLPGVASAWRYFLRASEPGHSRETRGRLRIHRPRTRAR